MKYTLYVLDLCVLSYCPLFLFSRMMLSLSVYIFTLTKFVFPYFSYHENYLEISNSQNISYMVSSYILMNFLLSFLFRKNAQVKIVLLNNQKFLYAKCGNGLTYQCDEITVVL